jgi:hypothetical protein
LVTLSAFSLLSFAGRIAGIASRLPLGFQGGFPRGPLSEFIHEEGTVGVIMPMMGVFNNLVIFDQHVPQNNMRSIVPELAPSYFPAQK